jgi:acetolactate synthase-1/2/3 large subunit
MDVFSQQIQGPIDVVARRPEYFRVSAPDDGIADAARLLSEADAPVIFAGNGVLLSDATDELKELAELLTIPVATTLMGKGAFPERHPLSLGMTGIWGTAPANNTTLNADVVLGIGTAFGEADCSSWDRRFTFAIPPSRLIQIDIDPQEVGKIYPVEVGLVGDARATLRALIGQLRTLRPTAESKARIAQIAQARSAWEAQLKESQGDNQKPIHPARLLSEIARIVPDDAIFVTDVGWNKNGAGQQLSVQTPRSFITSGGMATMGFAPGAADRRQDRRARPQSDLSRRRRRFALRHRRPDHGRRARHPGAVDRVQQLLLLDDQDGRHDVLQQQLWHGIHDAGR